jgi:DNA invertase Pin-like site-specific DNA recombinase
MPNAATSVTAPLIVYVRQSKTDGKEDGRNLSPAQQESRARAYGESHGYVVGETIADLDVSGGVHPRERPGMARALEAIRAGRAGGLVAFSLDRFSRDPTHGDDLVREVTSHGGVLLAPDMPEDIDSPTGEFTFGMLLQVARLYRRTAGARFALSVENAIARGIPVGRVPYGYRRKPDRTLEIDPAAAAIVRELYERRIGGEGFGVLTDWMMERTGRVWSRAGVSDLVDNPLYKDGRIRSGKHVSPVECGAIVDAATWQAAQRPKYVQDGRTKQARLLLSGLLGCAGCGHNLHPTGDHAERRPRAGGRRYKCACRSCPARASILAAPLERLVVERAFEVSRELVERPAEAVELAPLEEALAAATRRWEHVQTPEVQEAMGDGWAAQLRVRREEMDTAARELGEARARAGLTGTAGRVFQLGHIWDDLTPEQQREALQHTFERIVITKVPPRSEPVIEFVVRDAHPWQIEFAPAEIEPQAAPDS